MPGPGGSAPLRLAGCPSLVPSEAVPRAGPGGVQRLKPLGAALHWRFTQEAVLIEWLVRSQPRVGCETEARAPCGQVQVALQGHTGWPRAPLYGP